MLCKIDATHPGRPIVVERGTATAILFRFVGPTGAPVSMAGKTFTFELLQGSARSAEWVTLDTSALASGELTVTIDAPVGPPISPAYILGWDSIDKITSHLDFVRLGDSPGSGGTAQVTVDGASNVIGEIEVVSVTAADVTAAIAGKVDKAGDTMTGTLTHDHDTVALEIRRPAAPANSRRHIVSVTSAGALRFSMQTDAGVISHHSLVLHADQRVETSGEIVAPAATAAGRAATVTAHDAGTGRIQLAGRELGDTGLRSVLSWTSGTQDADDQIGTFGSGITPVGDGSVRLQRQGDTVTVHCLATGTSGLTVSGTLTQMITSALPAGFRAIYPHIVFASVDWGGDMRALRLNSHTPYIQSSGATTVKLWSATWSTSDGWPSSLPGVQVTAPASL